MDGHKRQGLQDQIAFIGKDLEKCFVSLELESSSSSPTFYSQSTISPREATKVDTSVVAYLPEKTNIVVYKNLTFGKQEMFLVVVEDDTRQLLSKKFAPSVAISPGDRIWDFLLST